MFTIMKNKRYRTDKLLSIKDLTDIIKWGIKILL